MDNELIIIGAFLGAGLLAYVIHPGDARHLGPGPRSHGVVKYRSENKRRGSNFPCLFFIFLILFGEAHVARDKISVEEVR